MRAREIKDLCIAMEALSRIAGYESVAFASRIQSLIDDLLKEEEHKTPTPKPTISDDIPF